MAAATNDVVQLLADRTAIAACRMHYSPSNSTATYAGTDLWTDLGALDPSSPAFDFTKNILDVQTGSPMTTKARHITSYEGSISAEIIDYNDNAINATIGTTVGFEITGAAGYTPTTTAAGTLTATAFTVTDATDLVVGDRVSVELGTSAYTWTEIKKIRQIVPGSAPAAVIHIEGSLSQAPIAGADINKVAEVKNIMGGNALKEYQMRMVCSFNDDSTMVIHAPKGNFTGPISPNMGDSASLAKIPVQFGVIATPSTVSGFTGLQVTLANHYAFYPNS